MKSISEFIPRAGALRYRDSDGDYQYANPHDLMYSTVTMSAAEYWNGTAWVLIHEDQHVETAECNYCQGAGTKVALVPPTKRLNK